MAKFTVEWLSQSFHSTQERDKQDALDEDFPKEPAVQGPSSPNNSCGYASASEASDPGEDTGEDAVEGSDGDAGRRARTKFRPEQIRRLEGAFSEQRYLGASQRRRLAQKLSLSETQVKTWFQNRRMKLKREVQDARTEFLAVPAALLPPVRFQPGLSGSRYPLQEVHRAAARPAVPRYHPVHPFQPYPALHALPAHRVVPVFY